ncbi:MAG: YggT family protein [Spirochaetota bacterium]
MIYLANVVRLLFSIYIILIFVRVLFAWLRPNMFNPLVRFVYLLTDPYLKLFANIRFLRVGAFDLSFLLAFYLLYLFQELSYQLLLRGSITPELLLSLILVLAFRFVYFLLFIFMVATGLRLIFDLAGLHTRSMLVAAVYSLSEPVVRPVRNAFRVSTIGRFDFSVAITLIVIVLLRYFVLPQVLRLLLMLIRGSGQVPL